MAGNKRKGIVIQERDRHLLRELAVMRVVDREQAKIAGGFHSNTRVNDRLLLLTRAGLLRRFFLGTNAGGTKALYALSAKGARVIKAPVRGPQRRKDETLAADFFIQHQLTINELYCALRYQVLPQGVLFHRWIAFFSPILPGLRLIPDGYLELQTPSGILAGFLEVDLGHERGGVWVKKVENYLRFAVSAAPEGKAFHRPFRVLVIAPTDRRIASIRKIAALKTEKIFWFASLEAIHRDGPFGPIWFRPKGGDPESLIKELP